MNSPHWNDPQLTDKAWERMRQSLDENMPVHRKKRRTLLLWFFPALLGFAGIAGTGYLLFGPVQPLEPVTPYPAPPAIVEAVPHDVEVDKVRENSANGLTSELSTKTESIPVRPVTNTNSTSSKNLGTHPGSSLPNQPAQEEKIIALSDQRNTSPTALPKTTSTTINSLTPETIIPVTPGTLLHPVVPRTEVLQSRYTLLDIAPVIRSTRHPWELMLLSGVGYRFSNQQTGVNAGFQAGTKVAKRWWLVSGYAYDLRRSTVYSLIPQFNSTIDPFLDNQVASELSKSGGPYVVSAFSLDAQAAARYYSGAPIYQHTHHFYVGGRYQVLSRLEWQSTLGLGLSNHPGTGERGQPVVQWNNQLQWKCFRRGRVYAGWQQPMNYAFFENDVKKLPAGELSMGLQWSIFAQ